MLVLSPTKEGVRTAAELLLRGKLVAFPTETVYGLGALATDNRAVKEVFKVKGRPKGKPLTLHVSGYGMFEECVSLIHEDAWSLIKEFWPGPLTVILPRAHRIPEEVTGGEPSVGVRWPSHPIADELIRSVGAPIVAPSANLTGRPSPLHAGDVIKELGSELSAVIDAGPCPEGIESTVIDMTSKPYRILRPGGVTYEDLRNVVGDGVVKAYSLKPQGVRRYDLRKGLVTVLQEEAWIEGCWWIDRIVKKGFRNPLLVTFEEVEQCVTDKGLDPLIMGSLKDPRSVGRRLFPLLRYLEKVARAVVVGPLPKGGGFWDAVIYRLVRASSMVVTLP